MIDSISAVTIPQLRADTNVADWIDSLEAIDAPDRPVVIPDGEAFHDALDWLAVPEDDVETVIDLRSLVVGNVDLMWLVERSVQSMRVAMDQVVHPHGFPTMPTTLGALAPFFHLYAYVTILPETLALHQFHGISESISRGTLADVGRNMLVHRKRHGTHGLAAPDWLMLHARGMIYQLGRLQFERAKIGTRTGDAIQAAGLPFKTGDPALSIHIPDFMGPMSEDACNASFDDARAFFPEHFPAEDYQIAVCNSWLLDVQLQDYLSPASNTIRFQQRFREIRAADWANDGPIRFVFGDVSLPLDAYPQGSSIQRAVIQHLQAGGSWHGGMGWMELQPAEQIPEHPQE